MGIAKELALDEQQIEEILLTQWNLRVATLGPGRRLNVTPMWFGWAGGKIYMYARGQKVVNLRRNPECPLCGDNPTVTGLIDYEQFCGVPSVESSLEPAEVR